MFVQLANEQQIRASAVVPIAETVTISGLVDVDAGGLILVALTTTRTMGTCAIQAQGSADNSFWANLPADMAVTIGANGLDYIVFKRAVPRYLRFVLTPAGGFDGLVSLGLRTDSALPSD